MSNRRLACIVSIAISLAAIPFAAAQSGGAAAQSGGAGTHGAGTAAQSGGAATAGAGASAPATQAPPPIDWRSAEEGVLAHQTQLTFSDRFVKAGEAYFSPDGRRVIFQAVEVPAAGAQPDEFYAMFVADLVSTSAGGSAGAGRGGDAGGGAGAGKGGDAGGSAGAGSEPLWRLDNFRRVSPRGSANTCGWFHPTDPNLVIFGSTIGAPTSSDPPGFQRGTNRYRWSFPPEMRVVQADLRTLPSVPLGSSNDIPPSALRVLAGDGTAYTAECTISGDGRTLLYCTRGSQEGDIFVKDLASGAITPVISAPGYDGGPFFSPKGDRLCYRSDRAGNNLLQVYVADLSRDGSGHVTGASREYALTANGDVNWCPYWHPNGRHLAYATSAVSHRNYEIFLVDAAEDTKASPPQSRYGTNPRRITNADGADVLPAFDAGGKLMMWTSQRAPDRSSQLWIADFVMPLDPSAAPTPAAPSAPVAR